MRIKRGLCCSVDECARAVLAIGLCGMHYQRKRKHGGTERRMANWHSGRYRHEQGYIRVHVGGNKYKMEHVLIAEKALGKPLPPRAIVHHVNEDPADNFRPWNLVVCPDQAYHLLLHRRARELGFSRSTKAGGG